MPQQSEISEEDWMRDRRLVMSELSRISNKLDTIDGKIGSDLSGLKIEVATLKTKVGLYAAVISAVAAAIMSAIVSYLMKR